MLLALVNRAAETNVPWGTQRSTVIGFSALFYTFPAIYDAYHMSPRLTVWLIQAWACFQSDYVDSGALVTVMHLIKSWRSR